MLEATRDEAEIEISEVKKIVAKQMVYGPRTKLDALSPAEIERCTRLPPPPEPRLNSVSRQEIFREPFGRTALVFAGSQIDRPTSFIASMWTSGSFSSTAAREASARKSAWRNAWDADMRVRGLRRKIIAQDAARQRQKAKQKQRAAAARERRLRRRKSKRYPCRAG